MKLCHLADPTWESWYIGLYFKTTRKLQLVQNAAVHTIMGLPNFAHVTSSLQKLTSFQFKVLVITFKVLCGRGQTICRISFF